MNNQSMSERMQQARMYAQQVQARKKIQGKGWLLDKPQPRLEQPR
jgi:hypothetical protein